MNLAVESQKAIDTYLAALRKQLRQLMDEDANDIVEEIRAHILDKSAGESEPEAIAAILAALGSPEELATRYRTDDLLMRAQVTRSPVLILRSLLRWGTLSFVGLAVFVVSVVGYCLGGALVLLAVFKVIWPRATGFWKNTHPDGLTFSFSSGQTPPQGKELLGWWLVPLGLVVGTVLLVLTFRLGIWCIRKFWRPRGWRREKVQD
jgi:hypothetical protein